MDWALVCSSGINLSIDQYRAMPRARRKKFLHIAELLQWQKAQFWIKLITGEDIPKPKEYKG